MKVELSAMTWLEAQEAFRKAEVVVMPVGATEEHGPHLPLSTDWIIPVKIAEKLSEKIDVIIAPPIPFGYSETLRKWPGTITLKHQTFVELVKEVGICLAQHGAKTIIAINGHGGNPGLLRIAGREIQDKTGARFAVINWWEIADVEIRRISKTDIGSHADEPETAMVYAARPEWARPELAPVQRRKVTKFIPSEGVVGNKAEFIRERWEPEYSVEEGKYGIDGDARLATSEEGKEIIEAVVENILEFLKLNMPTPST